RYPGSGQACHRVAGTLRPRPESPWTVGERGRMILLFVKAEPGRDCAAFKIDPGGQETGSPGLNAALPDSLRGSGNYGERRALAAVRRDYFFRAISSHLRLLQPR